METHPSQAQRTTAFSYAGMTGQETEEQVSSSSGNATKDFVADAYGHLISMINTPSGQAAQTFTYGYNVHSSISLLLDSSGNTRASYGYRPYGDPDTTLSQGDTDLKNMFNPFRYEAKRFDSGSQSLARDLTSGDHLLLSTGQIMRILAVKRYDQVLRVYNLSVNSLHTYFVGLEPVLVHNCGEAALGDLGRATVAPSKLGYLLDNPGKSGIFRDSMGFDEAGLETAPKGHLTENIDTLSTAENPYGGTKLRVTGAMTGPTGESWNIMSVWNLDPGGGIRFITALPS